MSSMTAITSPNASGRGHLTVVHPACTKHASSFEQIYQEWNQPIFLYILRLVGNREQAEDLTQETFLKAFRALPKTGAELKLAAWLYRIGTNTAYDALRRRKLLALLPWQDLDYELAAAEGQDPQLLCETRELVRATLQHMPRGYRAALLYYRVDGRSPSEIASLLGVAPSGIKTYLSRATASFLQHYTALGGEVAREARRTCSRTRKEKAS
jgi:RNA polymerase sigma-70 factor (ECF subfamily)